MELEVMPRRRHPRARDLKEKVRTLFSGIKDSHEFLYVS
jgi:hypothetical protein